MASLLGIGDDQDQPPSGLLGPLRIEPPDSGQPSMADAADAYGRMIAEKRAADTAAGLLDPQTGWPTRQGAVDSALSTAFGLGANDLTLERVAAWPGATGSLKHSYLMKNPAGEYVGSVDTTYHPGTKDLRIEDIRADPGPGGFGTQQMIGMRGLLRGLYPEAETISGNRISGANPQREVRSPFPQTATDQPAVGLLDPATDLAAVERTESLRRDLQSRAVPRELAQVESGITDKQQQIATLQQELDAGRNNPGLLPPFFQQRQATIAQHQKDIAALQARAALLRSVQ